MSLVPMLRELPKEGLTPLFLLLTYQNEMIRMITAFLSVKHRCRLSPPKAQESIGVWHQG